MKIIVCIVLLAALALTAAADVNVTGKWSGSFNIAGPNGETKDATAYMVLKQDGKAITGTAGPNEEQQWPIQNGKIEGDKITFDVHGDGPEIKFTLVLADEHIKGDATGSHDGETMNAKVDVTRVK